MPVNTYTIKYEAGAVAKTAHAVGTDIHDAIRSLGFKDSDTFMAQRVITWAKNGRAPYEPEKGPHIPIWETKLPFEIAPGDGALLAKALRAYRPETSEEEGVVNFFIDQFAKLDEKE